MAKKIERNFELCFEKTLKSAHLGEVSAQIVLVPHPCVQHIIYAEKGDLLGGEAFAPWFGSETRWLGAAAWVFPKHFQEELLASGGGGLSSHAHCEINNNEAYITHLGPVGARVSGSSWNSSAFHEQNWPYQIDVGNFDIQCGGGGQQLKKGAVRPSWWPEPLPMIERVWQDQDPPSLAPNLGLVAKALALQMRAEAAQAIFEEVGAEGARTAMALGTVIELPGHLARHFCTRDVGIKAPGRLQGVDLNQALQALEIVRSGFEAWSIERETDKKDLGRRPRPRI